MVSSTATLTPIDDTLSCRSVQSHYADVTQRWLLVRSEEAYQREMKTLIKNTLSGSQKETKAFETLCRQEFSCEADAANALAKFEKNVGISLSVITSSSSLPSMRARAVQLKHNVLPGTFIT